MAEIHGKFQQETQDIKKAANEKLQTDAKADLEKSLQTISSTATDIKQREDRIKATLAAGGQAELKSQYEKVQKDYTKKLDDLNLPDTPIEWSKQVEALGEAARNELSTALEGIISENPKVSNDSLVLKSTDWKGAVKEVQGKFGTLVQNFDDATIGRILLVYLAEKKGGPQKGVIEQTTFADFVKSFGAQAKSGTEALAKIKDTISGSSYEQGLPTNIEQFEQNHEKFMEVLYDAIMGGRERAPQAIQDQLNARAEKLDTAIQSASHLHKARETFASAQKEYLEAQIGLKHTFAQLRSVMENSYLSPEDKTQQIRTILEKIPGVKPGEVNKDEIQKFTGHMAKVTQGISTTEQQRIDEATYNQHLFNGLSLLTTTAINAVLTTVTIPLGGTGLALGLAFTPPSLSTKVSTTETYPVQASDLVVAPSYITKLNATEQNALGVTGDILQAAKDTMAYRLLLAKQGLNTPIDASRFHVLDQTTPATITEVSIATAKQAYEAAKREHAGKTIIPSPLIFAEALPQFATQKALTAIQEAQLNVGLAQGADTTKLQEQLQAARNALIGSQVDRLPNERAVDTSLGAHADARLQELVRFSTGSVVDRQALKTGKASMSEELYQQGLIESVEKNLAERTARLEKMGTSDLMKSLAFLEANLFSKRDTINFAELSTNNLPSIDDTRAAELIESSNLLEQVRAASQLPEFVGDQRIQTAFRWPWEGEKFPANMPLNKDTLVKLIQAGEALLPRVEAHRENAYQVESTKIAHIQGELARVQELYQHDARINALKEFNPNTELMQPIRSAWEELSRIADNTQTLLRSKEYETQKRFLENSRQTSDPQLAAYRELPGLVAELTTAVEQLQGQMIQLAQLEAAGKVQDAKQLQQKILATLNNQGNGTSWGTAQKILGHYSNLQKFVGEKSNDGKYTFTTSERRDSIAGRASYNAESTAQSYSDLKSRLSWQAKETNAEGTQTINALKDEKVISDIRDNKFNFFATFPAQMPEGVPAALVAKGAQVNLDAINHNMNKLHSTPQFKNLSVDDKVLMYYVEEDIRKLTGTIKGLSSGQERSIDQTTYDTLWTQLQRMSKYMLDGTSGNPKTSGSEQAKKLGEIKNGSEMLSALTGMKLAELQQAGIDPARDKNYQTIREKVQKAEFLKTLRATTNRETVLSNASLNLALQENIYKLQQKVEDINALLQKLNGANAPKLTPEFFGFNRENPFAKMGGDNPELVTESSTYLKNLETIAKKIYGSSEQPTKDPKAIMNNLKALNPRAIDYASRGRNSFSLVSAITPGAKLKINGQEVSADRSLVRAYNTLIAGLPFGQLDRQGNPDTKQAFLPKMQNFFKKEKYGDFSNAQLMEMIANAEGFTDHKQMTELFNNYLGTGNTKYPSFNYGNRGGESFRGSQITLQKGLFLKLPARHVIVKGEVVRVDSAIAFKENCLNPNPAVVSVKLSRVHSAHPSDIPAPIKLQDLPTEVQNHIAGATGEVKNINQVLTGPIILPYLTGTSTPGGSPDSKYVTNNASGGGGNYGH